MWNIDTSTWIWTFNSISHRYTSMSNREKLIEQLNRNVKRIGRILWVKDPVSDLVKQLNTQHGTQLKGIEDLDDISLEWLKNNSIKTIIENCKRKFSIKTQKTLDS